MEPAWFKNGEGESMISFLLGIIVGYAMAYVVCKGGWV